MSGTLRTRSTRRPRHRWWRVIHRTVAVSAMLFLIAEIAVVAVSGVRPSRATAAQAPTGSGFTVTPGDLAFILKQIKIAEHHSRRCSTIPTRRTRAATLVGPGPDQIPDRLTPYGLRTVDGSCNNLVPGPRDTSRRRTSCSRADRQPGLPGRRGRPAGFFGPGSPAIPSLLRAEEAATSFDSQPRVISNLIVDQTSTNPAAIAAAGYPVRTQGNPGLVPCTTDPDPTRSAGRGRPRGLHAVAQDPLHPERHDRRRPLAAVQLGVHLLRAVLRPRRRPDRQERRHGLRAAARPTTR